MLLNQLLEQNYSAHVDNEYTKMCPVRNHKYWFEVTLKFMDLYTTLFKL